jgi:hypothetical protein
MPEIVRTPAELDALPVGSVIAMYHEDGSGPTVYVKTEGTYEGTFAWEPTGGSGSYSSEIVAKDYGDGEHDFYVLPRGRLA